ncbi:universal stress protein [Chloroflexota bacterium]
MYRRILVVLQEKEIDEAVVGHVWRLATLHRARVTLLRVVALADDGVQVLDRRSPTETGSRGRGRGGRAGAYLARLERRLHLQGFCVKTALVAGTQSEADEIVRFANENGFDLIAMFADSRPWYLRLLGGNPASGVQHKSTVPTLFIHDGSQRVKAAPRLPWANTMMAVLGSASL